MYYPPEMESVENLAPSPRRNEKITCLQLVVRNRRSGHGFACLHRLLIRPCQRPRRALKCARFLERSRLRPSGRRIAENRRPLVGIRVPWLRAPQRHLAFFSLPAVSACCRAWTCACVPPSCSLQGAIDSDRAGGGSAHASRVSSLAWQGDHPGG
jgi:hypothetical protein